MHTHQDPTITVDGHPLVIETREYDDSDDLAVLAFRQDTGELYGDVSTNLPNVTPRPGCFFITDDRRRTPLVRALSLHGIIRTTGRTAAYGNFGTSATEYRLADQVPDLTA